MIKIRMYILEERRLVSDFYELEFKSGCKKYRKEKDTPEKETHTFECI